MKRDSRFELLRIVAILFITLHHLLLFGADVCGYLSAFDLGSKGIAGVALNSLAVTGVSLFVMLSGWFGMHRVWRPFFRLIIVCSAFGALAFVLAEYALPALAGETLPVKGTSLDLFSSMKFTNWWFIVHYLLLLLVSPLLEQALESISRRRMEQVLAGLLVFNLLFGFAWGYVNSSGYNVVHFVLLYLLARYMHLFPDAPVVRSIRHFAWLIIAVCVAAITLLFLADKDAWSPAHTPMVWNYNCPLVILEAMAIFSLFAKEPRLSPLKGGKRSPVNFVASFVLGVYLLQSAPMIVPFRNALGRLAFDAAGYAGLLACAMVLAAMCWLLSCALLSVLRPLLRQVGL